VQRKKDVVARDEAEDLMPEQVFCDNSWTPCGFQRIHPYFYADDGGEIRSKVSL
jgi:hypothetical protein